MALIRTAVLCSFVLVIRPLSGEGAGWGVGGGVLFR